MSAPGPKIRARTASRPEQIEPLPSKKVGEAYKCFAERRLQVLSSEISSSVVPNRKDPNLQPADPLGPTHQATTERQQIDSEATTSALRARTLLIKFVSNLDGACRWVLARERTFFENIVVVIRYFTNAWPSLLQPLSAAGLDK
jgi:hypothetical protein